MLPQGICINLVNSYWLSILFYNFSLESVFCSDPNLNQLLCLPLLSVASIQKRKRLLPEQRNTIFSKATLNFLLYAVFQPARGQIRTRWRFSSVRAQCSGNQGSFKGGRAFERNLERWGISFKGSCSKVPQTGKLKQQKCIVSMFGL